MINHGGHSILGVRIDAVDYAAAVEKIIVAAKAGEPCSTSALAVHGVMTGVQNDEHAYRLNHLDLVVPDGQPVRWALHFLHGIRLPDRVYGPTLTLKVCEKAAEEGLPIFLYGSKEVVLEKFKQNLQKRFPKLKVVGLHASRFRVLSLEEVKETSDMIKGSGAKIVLVGLGCPRQEIWAYAFRDILNMPILAVGAAFDFHAGTLSQAPRWMQNAGLEWFYRLCKEPKRLWRRYVLLNPEYLFRLAVWKSSRMKNEFISGTKPQEKNCPG